MDVTHYKPVYLYEDCAAWC